MPVPVDLRVGPQAARKLIFKFIVAQAASASAVGQAVGSLGRERRGKHPRNAPQPIIIRVPYATSVPDSA
eukprot:2916881-Rhodomonas_salina.3